MQSSKRFRTCATLAGHHPKYNKDSYSAKGAGEWASYWTSTVDPRAKDYAFLYQWYGTGGANNCLASKNSAYVRCVHDPIKK